MRTPDTEAIIAEANALNGGYTFYHLRHLTGATRTQLRILERDGVIPQADRIPGVGTRIWNPQDFAEAVRIVRLWLDGHDDES